MLLRRRSNEFAAFINNEGASTARADINSKDVDDEPPSGSARPLRAPSPGVAAVIWEIRSLCKAADRRPENAALGQFFAMPSTLSNPVPAHEYRPNLWGFCMMDRAT